MASTAINLVISAGISLANNYQISSEFKKPN